MDKIEKQILEQYITDYNIASASYEIMGLMLDHDYLQQRLQLFHVDNAYLYGGTYMAIQLYRTGKQYTNIKGIVDKSGKAALKEQISILSFTEFRKIYNNEKVIITSIRFLQEIKQDLQIFVNEKNILGIGELLMGLP